RISRAVHFEAELAIVYLRETRDFWMQGEQLFPVIQKGTPLAVSQDGRQTQFVAYPNLALGIAVTKCQHIGAVQLFINGQFANGREMESAILAKRIMQFRSGVDGLRGRFAG